MPIPFNKNSRFLFIGDAVTDANRSGDDEGIGTGYVRMIRDYLRAMSTATAPLVINRGRSGGRLSELLEQCQQEIVAARPDVLSFMIDVPDPHRQPGGSGESLGDFRSLYREVLSRSLTALPRSKLVLCEPPAVWSLAPVEADEVLRPYVHALFEIAAEFNAQATVPVHSALVYARKARPDIRWVVEDQLLSSSAHTIIAHTWLAEVEIIRPSYG
ncbi:MAG TPA: hypothetical protein VN541_18380 [Tepidisphaeraceae bacterium]|nr:hypothetical protein [Tepidisphaeraceae bacterium]